MRFFAVELTLRIIRQLRPFLRRIRLHDRKLANHLCDAASSAALNLSEGNRRQGRDRKHLWNIASGSADEAGMALRVAAAWGYLEEAEVEAVLADIDQLLAILWKLTR